MRSRPPGSCERSFTSGGYFRGDDRLVSEDAEKPALLVEALRDGDAIGAIGLTMNAPRSRTSATSGRWAEP